jgi:hypothetical protein
VKIRRGRVRSVLLIKRVAIKVPTIRNGPKHFLLGMLANILEAERWVHTEHPSLAPVLWSAPFGLCNVSRRYHRLITRALTKDELDCLPFIGFDNNGHNAAFHEGRVVLLDYGNADMYLRRGGQPSCRGKSRK